MAPMLRRAEWHRSPAEKADGPEKQEETGKPVQLGLFEENFLKRDVRAEYKLIGQVFETYWLVEYRDSPVYY